jgi:hypothetical protein
VGFSTVYSLRFAVALKVRYGRLTSSFGSRVSFCDACEFVRWIRDPLVCVRLIREPLVCVRVTAGEVGFLEMDSYIRVGFSGNPPGSDIMNNSIQTSASNREIKKWQCSASKNVYSGILWYKQNQREGSSPLYMKTQIPTSIADPCTDPSIPNVIKSLIRTKEMINLNHQPTEAVHRTKQNEF